MATVTFKQEDGSETKLQDVSGNLMEIAVDNDIAGITGDCGGVCSCSTCHVYVDAAWQEKVGAAGSDESDTLEFVDSCKPSSRLGCQIEVYDELNGLVVEVAPTE